MKSSIASKLEKCFFHSTQLFTAPSATNACRFDPYRPIAHAAAATIGANDVHCLLDAANRLASTAGFHFSLAFFDFDFPAPFSFFLRRSVCLFAFCSLPGWSGCLG